MNANRQCKFCEFCRQAHGKEEPDECHRYPQCIIIYSVVNHWCGEFKGIDYGASSTSATDCPHCPTPQTICTDHNKDRFTAVCMYCKKQIAADRREDANWEA